MPHLQSHLRITKPTKAEARARLRAAEILLTERGLDPLSAARELARELNLSHRQATRYCTAVRAIYSRRTDFTHTDAARLFLRRSDQALAAGDYGASLRAIELCARLHGLLDSKVKVEHSGAVQVQHVATTDLSTEELLALQAFHDARQRRLNEGAPTTTVGAPIESTASVEVAADEDHALNSDSDPALVSAVEPL